MTQAGFSLDDLAAVVGGQVLGDGSLCLTGIRPLDTAGPQHLSFLHKAALRRRALDSPAGALLLPAALRSLAEEMARPVLLVANSPVALAHLIRHFHPLRLPAPGIHPTAVLADSAEIGGSVHIGPYVVIGDGSRIGPGCVIEAHSVVGRDCQIGAGVRLRPHVVIYDDTVLGDRIEIHSGAVIGADGFGYATSAEGIHHKIPQVGKAVLEDDVEVGANSAVDRAVLDETRIGAGSKIDNLVQVGHNVSTGRSCIICAQVGIAGSAKLGNLVVVGGQVGVIGHLELGDQVQVAAKSAVFNDIEPGQQLGGIPAVELAQFRRQAAATGRLPDLLKRVRRLERQLGELAGERGEE